MLPSRPKQIHERPRQTRRLDLSKARRERPAEKGSDSVIIMRKLCFIHLLTWVVMCSTVNAQAVFRHRTIKCHETTRRDERHLCRTITPPEYYESILMAERLTLTTVMLDLNRDGRKELLVWESSWAGSSGGGLWIFSLSGRRLKKLIEIDKTWSPIILLKTKHHGWFDLAYFQTGGGVDELFVTIRHNGKRYGVSKSMKSGLRARS